MIEEMEERSGAWRIAITIIIVTAICAGMFWRWRQMSDSKMPSWGRGNVKVSERAYYQSKIRDLRAQWRDETRKAELDRRGKFDENYRTILVIDTVKAAMWLERQGQVDRNSYTELPQNMDWQAWRFAPEGDRRLPPVVRIKMRGLYSSRELPERIYIKGDSRGSDQFTVQVDSGSIHSDYGGSSSTIPTSTWKEETEEKDYYGSIVVSDEEYDKVIADETDKVEVEQKPLNPWVRMEKLIYASIEKQVDTQGYGLRRLEVFAGAEGTSARAHFECEEDGFSSRFSGYSRYETSLKIDYLGDDVWYAKTGPAFGRFGGMRNEHLDIDFLIYNPGTLDKDQLKKMLAKGRAEHPYRADPTSDYNATLPNGVTIELLGICKAPSIGRQWWSIDGKTLDYEPFFYVEPRRSGTDDNRYEIAWKYHWPTNTQRSNIERLFNGKNKHTSSRGGRHNSGEIIVEAVEYKEPDKPATLTFKIKVENQPTADEVTFANISFEPGTDHGVKIETPSEAKEGI